MKLRFYLFAVLVAVVPLVLVTMVTGEVALRVDRGIDDRVASARDGVAARLDADAARRRDLLVRLSALADVTSGVREAAAAGQAPAAEVAVRVRKATADIYPRELPELVGVATTAGAQLIESDGDPASVPVADLPGAGAALGGQFANIVALRAGKLVRWSAVPVGLGDGAIVLGDRLGDLSVTRLRDAVRAHVSFVVGGQVILSSVREAFRPELAKAIERPGQVVSTGLLSLGLPGFDFLDGQLPLLVRADARRSIAFSLDGGVMGVVTIEVADDLAWLGRVQLFALLMSLGILVAGFFWLAVITGPIQRQARSIEAHLARLRAERGSKLGTKGFTSPFIGIAAELDRLGAEISGVPVLQRAPAESTPKPPANQVKPGELDAWMPPAPAPVDPEASEGTPSAFPFGDDPNARAAELGVPPPRSPAVSLDPPSPPPRSPAMSLDPPAPPPAGRPPGAAKPPGRTTPEPLDPPMAAGSGADFDMSATQTFVKPIIKPPTRSAAPAGSSDAGGPIPLPSGKGGAKVDPITAAFGAPPEAAAGDKTRKSVVPDELLERSRELEQELMDGPEDPDEAHFREVFAEFQETRKKCGEPADGLTFDKFQGRLKKNREQLVAKFNCRTVRFQVYVKEGKAAIKAAPVK